MGGKILSRNGKEIVQKGQLHQVLCQAHSNIAHKGRDKMDKYIKRNYESVSQLRSNTTLCDTLLNTRRKKVDHQQAKTA